MQGQSADEHVSIFETIFCVLKDDRVQELEDFLQQTNDVNYLITKLPPGEKFCENSPPMISVACYYGSFNCFHYLQLRDADVNLQDSIGRLPVHFAAAGGSIEICDELDSIGADFHALDNKNQNALHYACLYGRIDLVQRFLMRGFDLEAHGTDCMTPIHIACMKRNAELLRFLCEQGGNINQSTSSGETPLNIVLEGGDKELLKVLVEFGVDTDFLQGDQMMTPLMNAIRNNQIEVVEILLSSKKEDVNKKDNLGWTALHYAAEIGNTHLCKMLVEKGADVNQCTAHKMTPLHLAQNRLKTETAEYLISMGAQTWV